MATPFPGNMIADGKFKGAILTNVQRALRRKGYTKIVARGYFGSQTREAVKDIQRKAHLTPTGNIGRRVWLVIDNYYLNAKEKSAITHLVFEQRAREAKESALRAREAMIGRIITAAVYTIDHESSIHYTMGPLRMIGVTRKIRLPDYPRYADCSSGATWLYWQAGAPDPNNRGYDGEGYTGTLAAHGTGVSPSSIMPGDLVFYGDPPTFHHVAVAIKGQGFDAKVWSHGSESGPSYRSAFYRPITGVRRYLM